MNTRTAIVVPVGVDGIVADLRPAPRIEFQASVDFTMANVWVGDRFRILPGEYGAGPVWGPSHDLFFGSYAHPSPWSAGTRDDDVAAAGQCVGVASLPLDDLDVPVGAARRWDGAAFADGPEDVAQRYGSEFELVLRRAAGA